MTCARPDTVTDPNGLDTTYDYDAFCREIRRDLPGGDYREFLYVSIGSPTAQHIETQQPAPAGEIWSRQYADGLGRVYRTSAGGPAAATIETQTTYAKRGTVSFESRPFFAGDQVYGTFYTTDALDRVIESAVETGALRTIFFTASTSWSVPADARRTGVIIELIGGGGGGANGGGGGGGGGAYAKASYNLRLIPTLFINVGAAGIAGGAHGGDTWFSRLSIVAPVSVAEGALAQGGRSATSTTGGAGGATGASIGTTLRAGGAGGGGGGATNGGGGGGGAAGPDAAGANGGANGARDGGAGGGGTNGGAAGNTGTAATGGAGGNNRFATGGGASGGGAGTNGGGGGGGNGPSGAGGNGSQQAFWTQTSDAAIAGPGAGGGAGAGNGTGAAARAGGNPGSYGGGGGGGGASSAGAGAGRNGAPGIIVVTYTPVAVRTTEYLTVAFGPGVASVVVTDELGRVTTTTHDAYGRTIETIEQAEAAYLTTAAIWSPLGNIVGITDPMGNRWSYEYDSLGRRVLANDPDLGEWTYAYDAAGRMTLRTDALGQETAFTYDDLGRVLTQTTRVGEPDQEVTTNTYDEVRSGYFNIGQLTTADNDTATITYDYDEAGRLELQSWTVAGLSGTKTEETGYHAGGQVLWKIWPDATSTGSALNPWTYDNTGLLFGIPDLITETQYNAAGQVVHIAYDNGVETDNTFDAARGWLMAVDTFNTGGSLQSVTYTRDLAGRVLTRIVAGPTAENWTYTYDGLDRLLSAANASDGSTSRTFTYDDAGNMLTNSGVGTYTYPAPGQQRPHAVTATTGTINANYTYDNVGNMLSGAGRTLTYDGDNRLVEVVTATATTTYAYAPDGDRIKTVVTPVSGPVEMSFILGATEINPAGTYIKVPHPDARIIGAATVCFVHRDQLASILFETDGTGAIALRQRYQPYGERVTLSGGGCAPESRGFIGVASTPAPGLLDLNARWYDPVLGRFINGDWWDPIDTEAAATGGPIGVLASSVGTNRYAYAANDPINKADANGHQSKSAWT